MAKDHSSFFNDVYEVVKLVPAGRVTSYGAIGEYLGMKRSARMVGWAMNGAPAEVPAHRVVNRAGLLTGKHYFPSPTRMEELLKSEGVVVKNDKVQNMKEVYWEPIKELSL